MKKIVVFSLLFVMLFTAPIGVCFADEYLQVPSINVDASTANTIVLKLYKNDTGTDEVVPSIPSDLQVSISKYSSGTFPNNDNTSFTDVQNPLPPSTNWDTNIWNTSRIDWDRLIWMDFFSSNASFDGLYSNPWRVKNDWPIDFTFVPGSVKYVNEKLDVSIPLDDNITDASITYHVDVQLGDEVTKILSQNWDDDLGYISIDILPYYVQAIQIYANASEVESIDDNNAPASQSNLAIMSNTIITSNSVIRYDISLISFGAFTNVDLTVDFPIGIKYLNGTTTLDGVYWSDSLETGILRIHSTQRDQIFAISFCAKADISPEMVNRELITFFSITDPDETHKYPSDRINQYAYVTTIVRADTQLGQKEKFESFQKIYPVITSVVTVMIALLGFFSKINNNDDKKTRLSKIRKTLRVTAILLLSIAFIAVTILYFVPNIYYRIFP